MNSYSESELPLLELFDILMEQQSVVGMALHRLITDEQGVPANYVFVYVNTAFESLTGLTRDYIIGKTVTDVLPDLQTGRFDWINTYGQVVLTGQSIPFEQHAESLNRCYRVTAYCPQPPYFVTLFQDITERKQRDATLQERATYHQLVFEHMTEGLVMHAIVYDDAGVAIDYRILDVNPSFERMLGVERQHVIDRLASDVYGAVAFLDIYARVAETMEPYQFDAPFGDKTYAVRVFAPRRGEFVTMFFDVTEERRHTAAQQTALRELSSPLIPLIDGVVVLPLIGSIDNQRAQQVQETLLEGVMQHRANTVILDITGVQTVDNETANGFMQAAQAVRLLGAQVMMTGIQPRIAQTLIHLGADLSGIKTYSSLQSGIAAVLQLSQQRLGTRSRNSGA
ncbi:MAG: PAS domain-containing protein [Chloroflexaceae bacterium]|nr:PAS domain-containing protein [Chloroflexaceae bacterium]